MKTSKYTEHEVEITYKPVPVSARDMMDPVIAWYVKVDDKKVGIVKTMSEASALLQDSGYMLGAFRRRPQKNDRPRYVAKATRKVGN